MIPGMNPKMMRQAMKKMGMKQEEIDAVSVVIKTEDSEIVFHNPQVSKVNMMGQDTWQIAGDFEERELSTSPEINEEDVKTVMEQTGVSEEKARSVIESHDGDLAGAILELSGNNDS